MNPMMVKMLRASLGKLNPKELANVVSEALISPDSDDEHRDNMVELASSLLSEVTYKAYHLVDPQKELLKRKLVDIAKAHAGKV